MAANEIPTVAGTKMGTEKFVRLSEAAGHHLSALLQKKGYAAGALKVSVVGGGCSGLQYQMELVPGAGPKDIVVESHGVRISVDPKSAVFLSGSEIDFSTDLQKGGFRVTNPNARATCSCGDSFST
ncbi:MAG: iron-sulfur cluster assembly accessory protein [Verrucomicrobia bacterium]|nr:iron-sulfur cluster assembly accessory protein [Verrucomicrobiota bacterium]NBR62946.1 iron-sulfur cluster assembly accessory protein [Verrucomicrobiota bacterium]NBU68257.1 iron-sulfur cluster assembly accessory protein [Verrucomicrobiota bacterium]NDB99963.1 iron-sulfur cluster assembly accessory protein [Verrucomicrobiota bacterium]NDF16524.1 iron-sulfur cluster assembly accessory protein [Verrucomicrobiota bacterium]